MIEVVIARSDDLDDATFAALRAALPQRRRDRCDRYLRRQDRAACVVAYGLVHLLWAERSSDPVPELTIGPFGKPSLAGERGWHFNLSHDASVCVCAAATASVGVDVQSRVPFDEGLFARMCSPGELAWGDVFRRADDLSVLWSRKEALLKRSGTGLAHPLTGVDALSEPEVLTLACDAWGVQISLCVEGWTAAEVSGGMRVRFLAPGSGRRWAAVEAPPRLGEVSFWRGWLSDESLALRQAS